jgi:hypothetical protein
MRHRKIVNSRSSASHSQTVLKNLTMQLVSLQGETPVSNVKAPSVINRYEGFRGLFSSTKQL